VNTNSSTNEEAAAAPPGAVHSEFNNLIADIEEVLAGAGHVVDLDVARLRDGLRQKLAAARTGIAEGGRRVSETARTAANATDEYVRRSPWQALGIAAVAGVALGYLLGRRRG
jgi:ElaB/YqjD/DUF883 family membrane-anchored ribosome-binding protein